MHNELYIISGLLSKKRWEVFGKSISPSDFSSKEARELFIRLDSLHKSNSDSQYLSSESFTTELPSVNEEDIDSVLEDFTVRLKLSELSMDFVLMTNTAKLLTRDLFIDKIQKQMDTVESTREKLSDRMIVDVGENVTRYNSSILPIDRNLAGGLSPGELFILASPPHGGKTHWLTSLATGYLLSGHDVIHFVLEDVPQDILKYYAIALGSEDDVTECIKNKSLTLLDYTDTKLYTSIMGRNIEELDRERSSPLVIVVDYSDIMQVHNSPEANRHRLQAVLEDLRKTANKHNAIMLTATQGDADAWTRQIPTMANLSESKIGKSQTGDIIVFWSQTPEERFRGDGRLVTVKARARGIAEPVVRVNVNWDKFDILET